MRVQALVAAPAAGRLKAGFAVIRDEMFDLRVALFDLFGCAFDRVFDFDHSWPRLRAL